MRGGFILYPGTEKQLFVPNLITDQGEESFLKMICQANVTDVASSGDFFIGLTSTAPVETLTLAGLTEPMTGGYARQPISRDTTGWPTVEQVGTAYRALTKQVVFSASGAAYDIAVSRAFLCNVVSGSTGILFALSGAFNAPITVGDGETLPLNYALYAK